MKINKKLTAEEKDFEKLITEKSQRGRELRKKLIAQIKEAAVKTYVGDKP